MENETKEASMECGNCLYHALDEWMEPCHSCSHNYTDKWRQGGMDPEQARMLESAADIMDSILSALEKVAEDGESVGWVRVDVENAWALAFAAASLRKEAKCG